MVSVSTLMAVTNVIVNRAGQDLVVKHATYHVKIILASTQQDASLITQTCPTHASAEVDTAGLAVRKTLMIV